MDSSTQEQFAELQAKSEMADQLMVVRAQALPILDLYILRPMVEKALVEFTKVDPDNKLAVLQIQIGAKMRDAIYRAVESRIQEGLAAREHLTSTLTPEDD